MGRLTLLLVSACLVLLTSAFTVYAYVWTIVVYNPNNYDLYNYTLRIVLVDPHIQTFGNSTNTTGFYFTDTDGNPLWYWLEYINATEQKAVFWVRVPHIPAFSSTVIYLHWNLTNPYINYSNPYRVFPAYLNGSSYDIDPNYGNWSVAVYAGAPQPTFANGYLIFQGYYGGGKATSVYKQAITTLVPHVITAIVKPVAGSGGATHVVRVEIAWIAGCDYHVEFQGDGKVTFKQWCPGVGDTTLAWDYFTWEHWYNITIWVNPRAGTLRVRVYDINTSNTLIDYTYSFTSSGYERTNVEVKAASWESVDVYLKSYVDEYRLYYAAAVTYTIFSGIPHNIVYTATGGYTLEEEYAITKLNEYNLAYSLLYEVKESTVVVELFKLTHSYTSELRQSTVVGFGAGFASATTSVTCLGPYGCYVVDYATGKIVMEPDDPWVVPEQPYRLPILTFLNDTGDLVYMEIWFNSTVNSEVEKLVDSNTRVDVVVNNTVVPALLEVVEYNASCKVLRILINFTSVGWKPPAFKWFYVYLYYGTGQSNIEYKYRGSRSRVVATDTGGFTPIQILVASATSVSVVYISPKTQKPTVVKPVYAQPCDFTQEYKQPTTTTPTPGNVTRVNITLAIPAPDLASTKGVIALALPLGLFILWARSRDWLEALVISTGVLTVLALLLWGVQYMLTALSLFVVALALYATRR